MDPRMQRNEAATAQTDLTPDPNNSPASSRRRERARSASSSTLTWIGVSSSPVAGDLAGLNGSNGASRSSKTRDLDGADQNIAEDDDHLRSSSTPLILESSQAPQITGTVLAGAAAAATSPGAGSVTFVGGGRRGGSSGRSSSVGLSFTNYQPAQPYPASAFMDPRSASAVLPFPTSQRLSDISESEDDTFEDDSPRSSTPPRSRLSSRSKRGGASASQVSRSSSAEAPTNGGAQNQFFSRWKLNKSVIPPEIQAYTDQVRRQHLIIDDSRDGTGSANSASSPSPRSPVRSTAKPSTHSRSKADPGPRSGMPLLPLPAAEIVPRFPPGTSGPRTSSLPHQIYLQYAASFGTPMAPQARQSSSPSSPRASSVVATPSWGFSPNPFFPHQFSPSPSCAPGIPKSEFLVPPFGPTSYSGPMVPAFAASPPFQGTAMAPAQRNIPFPPPYAMPTPHMHMPVPTSLHLPPPAHPQPAMLNSHGPSAQVTPLSPRTSSTVLSPFGASAPSSLPSTALQPTPSSLEALMKEKLFTLADVASHSHHVPTPSERMDVSDNADSDGDDGEDDSVVSSHVADDDDDDNRSGGSRMQL